MAIRTESFVAFQQSNPIPYGHVCAPRAFRSCRTNLVNHGLATSYSRKGQVNLIDNIGKSLFITFFWQIECHLVPNAASEVHRLLRIMSICIMLS